MKQFWWMTLEERQRKMRGRLRATPEPLQENEKPKQIRRPYKWGAKAFLSSFEVGESREYHEKFEWRNLISIASRMKREFGCQYLFNSVDHLRFITRVK